MRFSTRARACPFLVCICAHARCFHTRLFSAWERAAWDKSVQESEREEQKCQRGKEERKQKKKKSKDRLVARIGFRTVSNDTGQDATAAVMVPRIFLPLPRRFLSSPRWSLELGMKLPRRFTKVTGHTEMKRAPWAERPAPNYTPARISYTSWSCFDEIFLGNFCFTLRNPYIGRW